MIYLFLFLFEAFDPHPPVPRQEEPNYVPLDTITESFQDQDRTGFSSAPNDKE